MSSEDLTVFELEEPPFIADDTDPRFEKLLVPPTSRREERKSLHRSLHGTSTRKGTTAGLRKSTVTSPRNSEQVPPSPALSMMWRGDLDEAQSDFALEKMLDPMSALRWAECSAIRVWMTGNSVFAVTFVTRALDTRQILLNRLKGREAQLLPSLAQLVAPSTNRTSRLGTLTKMRRRYPTQLRDAHFTKLAVAVEQSQRVAMREWINERGMLALCDLLLASAYSSSGTQSVRRACWHLYSAWKTATQTRLTLSSNLVNSNGLVDFVCEVMPIIHLLALESAPHIAWFMQKFILRDVGASGEAGEARLLLMVRKHQDETREYAALALVLVALIKSRQEYRPDRAIFLKRASELLDELAVQTPDHALLRWAKSHVMRRLGHIHQASLDLEELRKGIQGQTRRISLRITFELASLAFAQGDWNQCTELLQRHIEDLQPGDACGLKGMVYAMLSACATMGTGTNENTARAVRWLEQMEGALLAVPKKTLSPNDDGWLRKVDVLYFRPHKRVLAYELTYLMGITKWFDADVGGLVRCGGQEQVCAWLQRCKDDLKILYDEAQISAVYPDGNISTNEDAAEELLVVALMCGSIASMEGDLDAAQKHFQHVIENAGTITAKKGTRKNPWHTPFALYELGVLEIKRNQPDLADALFKRTQRLCWFKNFSHYEQLRAQCAQARQFLLMTKTQKLASATSWRTNGDELGHWMQEGDEQLSPDDGKQATCTVLKGGVWVIRRTLKAYETITWNASVRTHDILFKAECTPVRHVTFGDIIIKVSDSNKEDDEPDDASLDPESVIFEPTMFESGDVISGFYNAWKDCVVSFTLDNTHAKHVDKEVCYAIQVSKNSAPSPPAEEEKEEFVRESVSL